MHEIDDESLKLIEAANGIAKSQEIPAFDSGPAVKKKAQYSVINAIKARNMAAGRFANQLLTYCIIAPNRLQRLF